MWHTSLILEPQSVNELLCGNLEAKKNRPSTSNCRCSDRPGSVVPETMVNLEIWMPAGFNMETWVNRRYIVDAGPLGPSGR